MCIRDSLTRDHISGGHFSGLRKAPPFRATGYAEACGNSFRAGSGGALACAVCAPGSGASKRPDYF
eukprot:13394469-Alexandrium_andersonii.AAC.1